MELYFSFSEAAKINYSFHDEFSENSLYTFTMTSLEMYIAKISFRSKEQAKRF